MKSKHGNKVREKAKMNFPYHKFEQTTKENFVVICLYIMYKLTPTSYSQMISELREVDEKEAMKFKRDILNYRDYIIKDVNFISENYGSNITAEQLLKELSKDNIQFYTMYFYLLFHPEIDISKLKKSRVYGHVLRKLNFLMKFFTFEDSSIEYIKTTFNKINL
jgi:hypothetical protein